MPGYGKVAVVMGSSSDLPVMEKCIKTLMDFGIETEVSVVSAHRTPGRAADLAAGAVDRGVDVIIAGAGKAAHLPGVLAAYTPLPVIGVPIKSSTMDGLDSLLSIVQMPKGVPVATVAIDGAENAALLAVQILSLVHIELKEKMKRYKLMMSQEVDRQNEQVRKQVALQTPLTE